jgi:type III secretion system chaperone SycN
MSWVDDAVDAFGRGMGLPRLTLPDSGALRLAFERRGTLFIERADDDILLYLQRAYTHASMATLSRALDACHWRHNRPFQVRAGLKEDSLVLLLRIEARDVALDRLERAFLLLGQLHDQIEA